MVAAGLHLLEAGGLPAVTIAAVAAAAGTSNGALYHRFGDRNGLLLAMLDRALGDLEADTVEAFARTSEEPDDDRALEQLGCAAVAIFARRGAVMRAFLAGPAVSPQIEVRRREHSHRLATTVTGWLRDRLGASETQAQAAWRVVFALGASRALFADGDVSPVALSDDEMGAAIGRAVRALVT
ncbi:TetR/AcrR family transcriptional regulator [Nocardioides sp. CBS4Y-1]|uniref:TetR/AcrR family transcriptional regulator n=2 Tax=Nocardioides acrostichi TaxID=2784339 RepID=A0A930V363_9ACTN|nr:TetR/AcrR family transcriptional regulator [Nocardioides acrostichi]